MITHSWLRHWKRVVTITLDGSLLLQLFRKPDGPQELVWMICFALPEKRTPIQRPRNPVWLLPVCQQRQQQIHYKEVTNRTICYSVTSWKEKGNEISSIRHVVRQSINIYFFTRRVSEATSSSGYITWSFFNKVWDCRHVCMLATFHADLLMNTEASGRT
jgi:hypothetical protein